MGKKTIIFLFPICLVMILYGQTRVYSGKIEWADKKKMEQVSYIDTSFIIKDLRDNLGVLMNRYEYTKSISICEKKYFFTFNPIGFGESIWLIEVFRQEKNCWNLKARGTIARPRQISAEWDSCKNRIEFYTLHIEIDKHTREVISLTKEEEIGELPLDSL